MEEKPAAKLRLGLTALRPLPPTHPKKPEAAELSSAHAEGGGGEPSGGKAVRPNALPPLASKGGGKSSDSPKSKAGVPSLGGAPGKGLVLPLQVEKALEMPRERTEREIRTEKLRRYERECNKVREFLFVGGEMAAANKELLLALGITHVINMAASLIPNHFSDIFAYTPLYLDDTPSEDISCHLYRLLHVIHEAQRAGGKVLVHCHQGVSRSCSVCIAYLMLYEALPYEKAFDSVKSARGICNPNAGFCSQLVTWGRLHVHGAQPRNPALPRLRAYRVERYSRSEAEGMRGRGGLAPKLITSSGGRLVLEDDKVYVLDATDQVYMWVGKRASEAHVACGSEHVRDRKSVV